MVVVIIYIGEFLYVYLFIYMVCIGGIFFEGDFELIMKEFKCIGDQVKEVGEKVLKEVEKVGELL